MRLLIAVNCGIQVESGVFGYVDQPMDMGPHGVYHVLAKDGLARAGLMQAPIAGLPAQWTPYVRVADCDASAARAAESQPSHRGTKFRVRWSKLARLP